MSARGTALGWTLNRSKSWSAVGLVAVLRLMILCFALMHFLG
jgi:uncharacterized membrane protein